MYQVLYIQLEHQVRRLFFRNYAKTYKIFYALELKPEKQLDSKLVVIMGNFSFFFSLKKQNLHVYQLVYLPVERVILSRNFDVI